MAGLIEASLARLDRVLRSG